MDKEKMIEELLKRFSLFPDDENQKKDMNEIVNKYIPEDAVVLTQEMVYEYREDLAKVKYLKDEIRKETAKQNCNDLIKIIKNNTDLNASVFGWTTEFILNMIKMYFKEKYGVDFDDSVKEE